VVACRSTNVCIDPERRRFPVRSEYLSMLMGLAGETGRRLPGAVLTGPGGSSPP